MKIDKRRLLALLKVRESKMIEKFEAMSEEKLTQEIDKIIAKYPQFRHFLENFNIGEEYTV